MADLTLTVDVSSIANANSKLNNFQKTLKNLSINNLASGIQSLQGNIRQLVEAQRAGTIGSTAYQTGLLQLKRSYEALGYSSQAATAAVRRYAQELQNQAATQAALKAARGLADANRRLRMEFKEGYAAQVQLRAAQMRLSQAHRQGIISAEEYARQLARLGDSSQNSSRHMSRAGVAMQQVGYQTGDFLVQIQSGQNAMVAFGQQATQMVGALYMLPAATLAGSVSILGLSVSVGLLIASLGIIIPLVTAFGAAFMRSRGKSKSFKESLTKLETSVSDYKSAMDGASESTNELNLKFGSLSDNIRPFLKDLSEIERIKAVNNLSEQFNKLDVNLLSAGEKLGAWLAGAYGGGSALQKKYAKDLGLTAAQYQKLTEAVVTLKESETTSDRVESAAAVRDLIKESTGGVNNMTDGMRSFYEQLVKVALAGGELDATITGIKDNSDSIVESIKLYYDYAERASDTEKERSEAVQNIKDKLDSELSTLKGQLELNKLILNYGKDSAEVKTLQAEQARNNYLAEQKAGGILGNNLNTLMEAYDENVKITGQLDTSADKGRDLAAALKEAASAMASLSGFGAGLDKALAVSVAKVNALKSGADAAIAGTIAGMRIDLAAKTQAALSKPGNDPILVAAESAIGKATISQLETSEVERKRLEAANRSSSRGGVGGGGRSKEDPRIAAQKAIDSLISSYDEEYAAMLKIKDAQDQVDKAMQLGILSTEKGKLIMDEYTKSLENAKNPMLDLANTMSSALGDALMSIVDGTKSASGAFKDMARIIIKQAFEMAVINPIINSIFGGVGGFTKLPSLFADGGVFSGGSHVQAYANGGVVGGGSHVQAYANGGVVGGPTYFPMSGGKTGLMGEAGPEAIMPLKRGSNGKLGVQMEGGTTTTVVQNFNFQANGDDSVKKLIAQAAPKIAQMTKSSLLDDRRRGGTTKAAFG